MPRRALPSSSILARIRAWFGLQQQDLALYLGVSQQMVQGIEAGRRPLSLAVGAAMLPLARQLPELAVLDAPLPATLPPGCPAPEAGELDFRRLVCLQRAAKLRTRAGELARRAHHAHRWQQALPALLPPPEAPDAEQAAWLTRWLQRRARPLSAQDVTQWHLLLAQAGALEAEAATLAGLEHNAGA